jgi:hypothetical protein
VRVDESKLVVIVFDDDHQASEAMAALRASASRSAHWAEPLLGRCLARVSTEAS